MYFSIEINREMFTTFKYLYKMDFKLYVVVSEDEYGGYNNLSEKCEICNKKKFQPCVFRQLNSAIDYRDYYTNLYTIPYEEKIYMYDDCICKFDVLVSEIKVSRDLYESDDLYITVVGVPYGIVYNMCTYCGIHPYEPKLYKEYNLANRDVYEYIEKQKRSCYICMYPHNIIIVKTGIK